MPIVSRRAVLAALGLVTALAPLAARTRAAAAAEAGSQTAGAGGLPHPRPSGLEPLPPGPPVLTVETPHGPRDYSLADIEAVGLNAMTIDLVWAGEGGTYHGVLLPALLRDAGLPDVPAVDVVALDGYHAQIPRQDWERWPIMLATRRDGKPLAVREKGPTRILYAMTPEEVLASAKMDVRWVWMVRTIKPATAPAASGSPS